MTLSSKVAEICRRGKGYHINNSKKEEELDSVCTCLLSFRNTKNKPPLQVWGKRREV